eukprot:gene13267-9110_t
MLKQVCVIDDFPIPVPLCRLQHLFLFSVLLFCKCLPVASQVRVPQASQLDFIPSITIILILFNGIVMSTAKEGVKAVPPQAPMRPTIPSGRIAQRAVFRRSLAKFLTALVLLFLGSRKCSIGYVAALFLVLLLMGFFEFVNVVVMIILRHTDSTAYGEALRRADTMPEPITLKQTVCGENAVVRYGCSSMQGWRRAMEDDHSLVLLPNGGFFGVYDGHGGDTTAKFCAAHLHEFVFGTEAYKSNDIRKGLHDGFVELDKHMFRTNSNNRTGCAAVVLYIHDGVLYCANAGDSRCVMCRNGESFPLSTDHKPVNASEQHRIERAGGYVWNRRVNGILALSRAIGDFSFKANSVVPWEQQAVTSAPEVRSTPLNTEEDTFAVLACDGIWDVMSSEQVIQFVKMRREQLMPLGTIAEELMDACLSSQPFGIGCDNMSVIIVEFKHKEQNAEKTSGIKVSFQKKAKGIVHQKEIMEYGSFLICSYFATWSKPKKKRHSTATVLHHHHEVESSGATLAWLLHVLLFISVMREENNKLRTTVVLKWSNNGKVDQDGMRAAGGRFDFTVFLLRAGGRP